MSFNLGGHCLNATWHLLSQNGVWLVKKSFDCYIYQSKVLVEITSQKCQPRPNKKVHGPITMDKFKTTCSKSLRGFFLRLPKMGLFNKKIVV
jgi:hypothetical protein